MKKNRSGFSMVELLFVMAVVAGLIAIAIPMYEPYNKAVVLTTLKADNYNLRMEYQTVKLVSEN